MNDDTVWVLIILTLIILFCGDPDLHDAVISRLMPVEQCEVTGSTE